MAHLLAAVKAGNRIHVGKRDENHDHIKTRHNLTARNDNQHGFVPSDNERMWLSRQQALSWLERFEPDIYVKVKRKVPAEGLHSHIYAAAKGIVMRITPEERKNGFNPQEGEQQDVTETTSLKDITLVVVDHGVSIHLAEKLVESFGCVYLLVPNSEAYPNTDRDQIGTGLEGVIRLYSSWQDSGKQTFKQFMADSPDPLKTLFFFPDVGFAGMQADLRRQGFKVCGSGDADRFELDKWFFQQEVEKAGLPVAKTVRLVGMKSLRTYLSDKPAGECFIKISFHRGLMETKKWLGSFLSSVYLDDLAVRLGRHADEQVFIVQHKIDSVGEIGMDSFCLNGEYPDNSLCSMEIKDAGLLGKVFEKQPAIIQGVNEGVKPILAKLGIAGLFSNEIRCASKTEGYFIDPTCRMPSPPGELMPEMYEKHCYAQALWDLANGRMPVLKPKYLFGAEIILTSGWLEECHWLPIEFPASAKKYIRLKNHCIKDGKYFIVPNNNGAFFGGAIGFGQTAEEACEMAVKYAETVQGEDVKYEGDVMEKARKGIADMAKIGITF
jgi:hypothetical protein